MRYWLPQTCTCLISLLRAQEVFGHVLWQHVGDQRFIPAPHLEHLLFLVMHANLPQKQLPGLTFQLQTDRKSFVCAYMLTLKGVTLLDCTMTHVASKQVKCNQHDNYHHGHEVLGWHHGCSGNMKRETPLDNTYGHTSIYQ